MMGKFACRGEIIARKGDLKVVDCCQCGFGHLLPLPPLRDPDFLYREHAPRDWIEKVRSEHEAGRWDSTYDRWLQALQLPDHGARLLDFGCGAGWFGKYSARLGVAVTVGVEISDQIRPMDESPGLTFVRSLEELTPGLGFHGIVASLVLEHLPRPGKILRQLREFLLPGGRLLVVVPNEFNPLQQWAQGEDEPWWISEVHLNYFTPHTLRKLLCSAGFQIIEEWATFPMELFLLLGLDYRRSERLGRRLHRLRLRFDPWLGSFYRWCARKGFGREITMVAQTTAIQKKL